MSRRRISKRACLLVFIAAIWFGFLAWSLSGVIHVTYERLKVTALAADGSESQVIVKGFTIGQSVQRLSGIAEGSWAYYKDPDSGDKFYCGWLPGDERQPEDATPTVFLNLPVGSKRSVDFLAFPWCGNVELELNGEIQTIDTKGEYTTISLPLPDSTPEMMAKSYRNRLPAFASILSFFACFMILILLFVTKRKRISKIERYKFLFSELVKRDFAAKYKRTILGMLWSILSPLLTLLIMWLVFSKLLGTNINHFAIYMFTGQLVYNYFCEATTQGMTSLLDNAGIFTKVNVPKYLFLFSKNISSLINCGLTLLLLFIFILVDKIPITINFVLLLYPLFCLIVFNVGVGLILSALYVFFRDMQYLWGVLTQLIMWVSAIFYSIESFSYLGQCLFLLNPIYVYLRYFRKIILEGTVPTLQFHLLAAAYALIALGLGCFIYKKYNHEFLYYV